MPEQGTAQAARTVIAEAIKDLVPAHLSPFLTPALRERAAGEVILALFSHGFQLMTDAEVKQLEGSAKRGEDARRLIVPAGEIAADLRTAVEELKGVADRVERLRDRIRNGAE